jgi:hypothetical protein
MCAGHTGSFSSATSCTTAGLCEQHALARIDSVHIHTAGSAITWSTAATLGHGYLANADVRGYAECGLGVGCDYVGELHATNTEGDGDVCAVPRFFTATMPSVRTFRLAKNSPDTDTLIVLRAVGSVGPLTGVTETSVSPTYPVRVAFG